MNFMFNSGAENSSIVSFNSFFYFYGINKRQKFYNIFFEELFKLDKQNRPFSLNLFFGRKMLLIH